VLALALASTSLAYLIFFRLIRDLGPIRATSVTFLIPAFGVLWGVIFLGEPLTVGMLMGFGLVLSASILVLKK
jgi:drug/metabolite transporter (DMT)-like permease